MRVLLMFVVTALMASTSFAEVKPISVRVKGMVCGFCAQGIEKKFKAMGQVQDVKVSLETKLVTVIPKEGQDVSDKAITDVLTEAGYNVEKIER